MEYFDRIKKINIRQFEEMLYDLAGNLNIKLPDSFTQNLEHIKNVHASDSFQDLSEESQNLALHANLEQLALSQELQYYLSTAKESMR